MLFRNTFFVVGVVGLLGNALLHLFVARTTGISVLAAWVPSYLLWLGFVGVSVAQVRNARSYRVVVDALSGRG